MLHIICALPAESKPIIERLSLRKIEGDHPFALFCNPEKGFTLTVSGIGKLNAAASVSYSYLTLNANRGDAWLNIGVAGHAQADIGELVLANRISDQGSGLNWYPQCVFETGLLKAGCKTVDQPSVDYDQGLLDMEASGFYSSAIRFSIYELVHVLKIVSDNRQSPADTVNKNQVSDLVKDNIPKIVTFAKILRNISNEHQATLANPEHFDTMLQQWHFTKTQEKQLKQQLRRWAILKPDEKPLPIFLHSKTARSLLIELTNMLDNTEVCYD